MKKHVKIYLESNHLTTADTILCEIRAEGCESIAVDIHHIDPRGMGGDKTKDVPEDLIAACRNCHNLAEAGKIEREVLKEIVLKRIEQNG
jgi:5-methylcytosine-specific restriction endonuclease McrA